MNRVLRICVFAGAMSAGAAQAAPSSVGLDQALKDGVSVCNTIVQSAYSAAADPALTLAPASNDARPANLKGFFFKDVSDVKWASRPSTTGAVFIGWSAQATKCSVFVLGTSADTALDNLRRHLETTHTAGAFGKDGKVRGYENAAGSVTLIQKDYVAGQASDTLTAVVTIRGAE
jgi:hypothetical protein